MRVVRAAPKKSSIASEDGREGFAGRSEAMVNARVRGGKRGSGVCPCDLNRLRMGLNLGLDVRRLRAAPSYEGSADEGE